MHDPETGFSPLPPTPVLSYETGAPSRHHWLGRLLCGLAMMNGFVSVGYIAASRVPGRAAGPADWTDIPVVVSGLTLVVFGALGLFRVSGSRLGIIISALVLLLFNCAAQWVYSARYGSPDISVIANFAVSIMDDATIPLFLVICLLCEPIKRYFSETRG